MSAISEAVEVMDRAGKVIDGLSQIVERLKRDNAAMLLELEHELEELDGWLCDDTICDDTKASMLIREDKIQKVVRLAKGESR